MEVQQKKPGMSLRATPSRFDGAPRQNRAHRTSATDQSSNQSAPNIWFVHRGDWGPSLR